MALNRFCHVDLAQSEPRAENRSARAICSAAKRLKLPLVPALGIYYPTYVVELRETTAFLDPKALTRTSILALGVKTRPCRLF
jgi:hypothetical protein